MPKLKKQPKNGYFFFIMEKKQERESEGYIVGNFQNASQLFGHLWTVRQKYCVKCNKMNNQNLKVQLHFLSRLWIFRK